MHRCNKLSCTKILGVKMKIKVGIGKKITNKEAEFFKKAFLSAYFQVFSVYYDNDIVVLFTNIALQFKY